MHLSRTKRQDRFLFLFLQTMSLKYLVFSSIDKMLPLHISLKAASRIRPKKKKKKMKRGRQFVSGLYFYFSAGSAFFIRFGQQSTFNVIHPKGTLFLELLHTFSTSSCSLGTSLRFPTNDCFVFWGLFVCLLFYFLWMVEDFEAKSSFLAISDVNIPRVVQLDRAPYTVHLTRPTKRRLKLSVITGQRLSEISHTAAT